MEKDVLLAYISESAQRAAEQNVPCAVSKFLDMPARSAASALSRRLEGRFIFWGGFDGAERTLMLFIPDYVPEGMTPAEIFSQYSEPPLTALKLSRDKFSTVTHRDYLGAVMALGLTRESIGDIVTTDDGAMLAALPTAAKYIAENLKSAGRASLRISEIPLAQMCGFGEDDAQEITASVASARLDCIVSALFHLSRSNAAHAVEAGLCFLNDEQIVKPDKLVSQGDKIVLRGSGKAIVDDFPGHSKKGRLRVLARRFK